MKIEINLDETRFKDLVDGELEKFSDEELHDILSAALKKYVVDNNVISGLFYKPKKDWYGKETGEYEPTYRLQKLLDDVDVSEQIEGIKSRIDKVFQEDDIIKKLVEGMFYRFITERLGEVIWTSSSLNNLIRIKANEIIDSRENEKQ